MEQVSAFLDALGMQSETLTALSVAGLGAVGVLWAQVVGLAREGLAVEHYRRPALLVIPGALFLIALSAGYMISMATTGFYLEVVRGSTTLAPEQRFTAEYDSFLRWVSSIQLGSSFLGVFSLSVWFAANQLLNGRKGDSI